MAKNAPGAWTRLARWLHWGMALAILIEVPAGLAMAWTYAAKSTDGQAVHLRSSQIHHTIGMLLIGVVLVRLWWRWRHGAPALPAQTPRWQAVVARGTQALLYGLLLLVPLSGYAALSAMAGGAGYPAPPLWLFTHNGFGPGGIVPHIVPPVAWNAPVLLNYGLFARAHVYMLMVGGGLLALHVGAALFHHFVRRDGVLAAMLGRGA